MMGYTNIKIKSVAKPEDLQRGKSTCLKKQSAGTASA